MSIVIFLVIIFLEGANMIGNYIKEIRSIHNIKVVELANVVGVSQPYISNIENEKRFPTVELFFRIIYSLAELSPFNYDVQHELEDSIDQEKKVDFYIADTLGEFWDLYHNEIIENLNSYLDYDEKPITNFEEFKEYISNWNLDDMTVFPEYEKFLDNKFGVDNYGEFLDYNNYSSYNDPDYVKSLVLDYWYQRYLEKFIEFYEETRVLENNFKHDQPNMVLNTVTEYETEIYKAVRSLRNKTGIFSDYQFKEINKQELTDLSILDNYEIINLVTLDGKKLTTENIISIRNTINGIRYERKL